MAERSSETAAFTIVSNNYRPFARVLMRSLEAIHPEWRRYVLLVDEPPDRHDGAAENFKVVTVGELDLPNPRRFFFRYDILELNTAVKPWMFQRLLEREGFGRVVYLDPDIRVYAPLAEVERALGEPGSVMVLTPHLTAPPDDDRTPGDLEILRSGSFNLGFLALRAGEGAGRLLSWWRGKLEYDCVVDIQRGLFVDQRWMDLAPGLFGGATILRDEGCNVAYWNLKQRPVERRDGCYMVKGRPLVFFHFSGLDPLHPGGFSKHQDRFTLEGLGDARGLVEAYCEEVVGAGLAFWRKVPYAFGRFRDGSPVPDLARKLYRKDPLIQVEAGDDPFATFALASLNRPWSGAPREGALVTVIMRLIWEQRPDLQLHFPDVAGKDRETFARWFASCGAGEHGLPERFVDPVRASLSGPVRPPPVAPEPAGKESGLARVLGRFLPRLSPPSLTGRAGAAPQRPRTYFWGFYADESVEGEGPRAVWMGPVATVKLPPGASGLLTVEGYYDPSPFRLAGGRGENGLEILVDGASAGITPLAAAGPFSASLLMPPRQAGEVSTLTLRPERSFIPRAVGLNDDPRELSLRISRVTAGGVPLLDFGETESPFVWFDRNRALVPGLNIVGYLQGEFGVGEGARCCAAAAEAAGIPFTLHNFESGSVHPKTDDRWTGRLSPRPGHRVNLCHVNADQFELLVSSFGAPFFQNAYTIGYWAWELPEFPDRWIPSFGRVDEVWCPSRFCAEAIQAKASCPVLRMPHALEFGADPRAHRGDYGLPEKEFLFLCMYDMHSYQARKNPEAALEAFRRAFPDAKGVRLVVKSHNVDHFPREWAELQRRAAETPGVVLIGRTLSRQQVYDLESLCDAYLSLHRSEGFGLGLAESMYLGKPVVGTDWSGNTDFMDRRNSCPVDYELVRLERDHGPYRKGQVWAEPDVDHAAWYLRRLVEDEPWREAIGARAALTLREEFSPRAVGERYRRRLQVLAETL